MTTRREGRSWSRRTGLGAVLVSVLLALLAGGLLSGCGVGGRVGKQFDGPVGDILFDSEERVTVALAGDELLNPDAEGSPLSVVVRIYQLDSLTAFSAAAAGELWRDAESALGDALLSEREVIVLPGGRVVDRGPMARDTEYVAVVAFFRQMPDARWRLVFDAAAMRKDGILTSPDGVAVSLADTRIEPVDDSAELLASADDI